jgi:hypothetical protein
MRTVASLADLQQRFARSLQAPEGTVPEFDIGGAGAPADRMDIYPARGARELSQGAGQPPILLSGTSSATRRSPMWSMPSLARPLSERRLERLTVERFGAFLEQHPSRPLCPTCPTWRASSGRSTK